MTSPDQTSEAEKPLNQILTRSKQGDVWAFRQLVDSHQQYAFSLAFRIIADEDDARDIVQESFIRVWKHIKDFVPEAKFTTWLYKIVVNVAYDRLKAEKRRQFLFMRMEKSSAPDQPTDGAGPDTTLMNRDLAEKIKTIAQKLPVKQRLVFVLRDLQDLSVDEVAEVLEMSRESVKTNLCYARQQIRRRLEQMEKWR